ncbi:Ionotropic glutamate receptor [Trinorchestia longiramus]|nr:Ionotropic glutamate receptor [Trinorchestia longiramus]
MVSECSTSKYEQPTRQPSRRRVNPSNLKNRNGLHLILCDSSTEILEKEFRNPEFFSSDERQQMKGVYSRPHWMILDDKSSSLPDHTYVPLGAKVMKIRKSSSDSYSLEAVWTPALGVSLRSAPVGYYQPNYSNHNRSVVASGHYQPDNSDHNRSDVASGHQQPDHSNHYRSDAADHSAIAPIRQHKICYLSIGKDKLCLTGNPPMASKTNLTGMHFVVTALRMEKMTIFSINKTLGRTVMTGVLGELLEIMKDIMNFTYSVTTPSDNQFGSLLSNGSWTGMVGDLVSDRADIILAYLSRTLDRDAVVSFSSPLAGFSYRIYAQRPGRSGLQWEAYVRSFDTSLWYSVILAYLVLASAFAVACRVKVVTATRKISQNHDALIEYAGVSSSSETTSAPRRIMLEGRRGEIAGYTCNHDARIGAISNFVEGVGHSRIAEKNSTLFFNGRQQGTTLMTMIWNSCFVTWTAFMQQGYPHPPRGGALRVLFLLNYILGLLLLTSYSAMLVSFLTVVDSTLPFTSLQSLADHGGYKLGILNASSYSEFMKVRKKRCPIVVESPAYIALYERLVKPYSDTEPNSFEELRLRGQSDRFYAYMGPNKVEQANSEEFICSMTDSKVDVLNEQASLAFKKGFHFAPLFNHYINVLRESGIIHNLGLRYFKRTVCSEEHDMSFQLNQVFTAFLVLGGGGGVAIVVLLLEMFSGRH